jgi:hypothetical protein
MLNEFFKPSDKYEPLLSCRFAGTSSIQIV